MKKKYGFLRGRANSTQKLMQKNVDLGEAVEGSVALTLKLFTRSHVRSSHTRVLATLVVTMKII